MGVLGDITNVPADARCDPSSAPVKVPCHDALYRLAPALDEKLDHQVDQQRDFELAAQLEADAHQLQGPTKPSPKELARLTVPLVQTPPELNPQVQLRAQERQQQPDDASVSGVGVAGGLRHDDLQDEGTHMVAEYASDIFHRMLRDEERHARCTDPLASQPEITVAMRAVLVDWLIEVHEKMRLQTEVLFLAVDVIDRYLAVAPPVARQKFQLVGVAALSIAAKFEDARSPTAGDLLYVTANSYSKEELFSTECAVLNTLGFCLARVTAAHFSGRLQAAVPCDEVQRQLAQYAAELSLLEPSRACEKPSVLASAALLVARELTCDFLAWPSAVADCAGYDEEQIRECADRLCGLLQAARSQSASASTLSAGVRKKFSSASRCAVAALGF